MTKKRSDEWLRAQIDEATRSVELWPAWMKRVAMFDGERREPETPQGQTTDKKTERKVA